jgi:hypothetical protein
MTTPVVVVLLSTSRSVVGGVPSGKRCLPDPSTRMDHQQVLVDEAAIHQRLDQLSAAHDLQLVARLRLEPGDGVRDVPLEQRGVAPRQGLAQRP